MSLILVSNPSKGRVRPVTTFSSYSKECNISTTVAPIDLQIDLMDPQDSELQFEHSTLSESGFGRRGERLERI
jgi:hypothetical protein